MPRQSTRNVLAGPKKGLYANYFEVGHAAFEIVLDFGQVYAEQRGAPCHTRIVMSPVHAHALLDTLGAALKQHETNFGRPDDLRDRNRGEL